MSQILTRKNRLSLPRRPSLLMAGDVEHAEFREIVQLLHADAELAASASSPLELIVFFHCRPLSVQQHVLHALRKTAPLAGVVVVAGSWCEGELRTGRVWPGVHRHYWYEFPAWWRTQIAVRAAGRCPEWARPSESTTLPAAVRPWIAKEFVILSAHSATAEALADQLLATGCRTTIQSPGRHPRQVRGATFGIWDGGQLNDNEAQDLSRFCADLHANRAPVIALLDFPRRDSVDRAIQLGAATVLGKPWRNANLLQTIEQLTTRQTLPAAA